MKQQLSPLLFLIPFIVGCEKSTESDPDTNNKEGIITDSTSTPKDTATADNEPFTICNNCICIEFIDKIGEDFDSAKDSLIKIYEQKLDQGISEYHFYPYSGTGFNFFYVNTSEFKYEDRQFFAIEVVDKAKIKTDYSSDFQTLLFDSNVLDDKGNLYKYNILCDEGPEDEIPMDPQWVIP